MGRPAGRKLGCKSLGGWERSRSVRPGGKQSTRPYAKANRLSLEMQTHPDLQQQEASADGGRGSAEPVYGWRRLSPTGKNWTEAPAGLPGVGEDGMVERNGGERRKVSVPANTHPYGMATRITVTPGSRGVGPRLAAEVVVAEMGRTTQPPRSQGPLGEGGPGVDGLRAWPSGPTTPAGDRGTRACAVKGPNRSQDEGGGQPGARRASRTGCASKAWPATGNAAAEMPSPLAGRRKTPCPVGWGRAGNGVLISGQ